MLVAMARLVEGLRRHDAHLVLQVHDELVVEVAEAEAPTVEQILVHVTTEAFAELFPMAPLVDLSKPRRRGCGATRSSRRRTAKPRSPMCASETSAALDTIRISAKSMNIRSGKRR
jgi:hypothetical protein